MKLDLILGVGDECIDDLTRERHKIVGVTVTIGTINGTRYAGPTVGYWLDSDYLGGGRYPWEVSPLPGTPEHKRWWKPLDEANQKERNCTT